MKPEQGEPHLPGAVQLGGLAHAARHALYPGGAHPFVAAQVGEPDKGVLLVTIVVGSSVELQLSPGPCEWKGGGWAELSIWDMRLAALHAWPGMSVVSACQC